MNILYIFVFFIVYSFLGWAVETVYCSVGQGKFVYRGMLNGPICPIYGFGALFVLYLLGGLRANPFLLFFASVFITSVLEYITSFVLERIFDMKWWDYSNRKFNINGRVCLRNSTLFGLLSLVFLEIIHPRVSNFINRFSYKTLNIISMLFFTYFILDFIFTVADLLNLKPYLKLFEEYELKESARFKAAEKKFADFKSNIGKELKEREVKGRDRIREFKVNFSNKRIFNAYPNLKSSKYPKSIKNIRKHINTLRENKLDKNN